MSFDENKKNIMKRSGSSFHIGDKEPRYRKKHQNMPQKTPERSYTWLMQGRMDPLNTVNVGTNPDGVKRRTHSRRE
jgi:hypothetical protein